MDVDLADPSHLASVSVGLEGRDQKGILQELRLSLACINFDGAGSSRVKPSEAEGFVGWR